MVRRRGRNLKTILLVGAGELASRVVETIESHRELGFRIVGALAREPGQVGAQIAGVRVIARVDEIDRVLDATPVDQVIIALPADELPKVKELMDGLALRTVDVKRLRGQTSIQKRIEYDLYYIENWSLLLDLKILARTALGGFLSKNAY